MKASIQKRHTQQILTFKIEKIILTEECKKDSKDLGKVGNQCNPNKLTKEEEEKVIQFLKKYPGRVYTGPFDAGGWFQFVTTVETSELEDIRKLQSEAIEENKRTSAIAAKIRISGTGGGDRYVSFGHHKFKTYEIH